MLSISKYQPAELDTVILVAGLTNPVVYVVSTFAGVLSVMLSPASVEILRVLVFSPPT